MLAYMKRTTVKISDELDARLRHVAARDGKTVSELTREALEAHLGLAGRRRLGAKAAGRSGDGTISERIEEILAEEWGRASR
jgi:predicted DNA-binding protein